MKRIEAERVNGPSMTPEQILHMAEGQRPSLAVTFEDLLGDGGPSDETAEEMITAIRTWRKLPSARGID